VTPSRKTDRQHGSVERDRSESAADTAGPGGEPITLLSRPRVPPLVTWEALFERATRYDVSEAAVRTALATVRDAEAESEDDRVD